ncbi:5-deoxy-glucuronate isomerase [Arthrobacter citreus]|nr:5-deoxy-glucuronate isomerase [Arthrobacter citreus]
MTNLIVHSLSEPNPDGSVMKITPESANWDYVGFEAFVLKKGQSLNKQTNNLEVCIVLLSGKATIYTKHDSWESIGRRMNIFEKIPPYSVYISTNDFYQVEAITDLEIAVCSAPSNGTYPARLIAPEEIEIEIRGAGNIQRQVHNILPENEPADSLLVVEVFTPEGNSSSYPPHKHDQNNLPHESLLEETYYHRMNPSQGIAIQKVYTDDLSLNETMTVKNGDAVLVPKGYHPVSALPGYELYYLNVMAGPNRTWKFKNDPNHEWILNHKLVLKS